jgi:phosphonate transport system substrate-binding protein
MTDQPSPKSRFSIARVLLAALIPVLLIVGYYVYEMNKNQPPGQVDVSKSLHEFARQIHNTETLDKQYTDADGDKLADPPKDASKWLNPAELSFCFVAQDDPAESEKAWQPLMEHLAKATGKPVKFLKTAPASPGTEGATTEELRSADQQVAAIRDGRLHITALNTGAVPMAVNTAGFHPLAAPADAAGKFDYQMQIIVPAASPIQKVEDLKDKTLGFVAMSSNSGGRAPLVILRDEFKLQPGRDYTFVLTGRHERSIEDLIGGKTTPSYQAACVASDILQQMVADQRTDTSRYRVIYTSLSFPKVVFGVPHNLDPALRAKIAEGFKTFRFAGTTLEKKFSAEKRTQFAAVEYSKAFADVLTVNRKLVETYGGQP